ncbi:TetR/AcrR family transcriptional regulator [Polaromonas sp. JS666]|uniref:TetR/AcrR family transcriptional regulator n=1 Tax=Polaromonas sp. (strain JS666 / ATCC BAA-500) TaxID=296591 RepID=UPI0000464D3C|nr:TetR/AcrR family transcriptional regulator [Polaromonas sp. JS666]ABE45360.1 transcriptional regulator, TetR family [Polaromonas sp. JS666]
MVRPSQYIDQILLDAGLELLPVTGCAGLSVRRLTQHAGVNLGMFHYHFKTKENFIKAVLERTYEEMFSALTLRVNPAHPPMQNLRDALGVLGSFGIKNGRLLVRIMGDAMNGEPLAADFLKANLPRHVEVIASLVQEAQWEGSMVKAPVPQVIAFMAGAVAAPVLAATALQQNPTAQAVAKVVLSEEALAQRIEFALRGLTPSSGDKRDIRDTRDTR